MRFASTARASFPDRFELSTSIRSMTKRASPGCSPRSVTVAPPGEFLFDSG